MAHTEGHLDPSLTSKRWTSIKTSIKKTLAEDLFVPYCLKNFALMVQHRHEWLEAKMGTFVPRKTAHRSSLPRWFTPTTSMSEGSKPRKRELKKE